MGRLAITACRLQVANDPLAAQRAEAAVWLPQVWRYLQKRKVSPLVGGQIEIGFSILGPVFNPKVTFRNALLWSRGIDYFVAHERG